MSALPERTLALAKKELASVQAVRQVTTAPAFHRFQHHVRVVTTTTKSLKRLQARAKDVQADTNKISAVRCTVFLVLKASTTAMKINRCVQSARKIRSVRR